MNEQEKDYSLLCPFDPEAAKGGAEICNRHGQKLWDYVAGPDAKGNLVVQIKASGVFVDPENAPFDVFCMAPLCWVEGKPVYKGDVLYHHRQDRVGYYTFTADCFADGRLLLKSEPDGLLVASPENLSWTPPKVKREIKLLAYLSEQGELRWVSENAPKHDAHMQRVQSEDKIVTVEE